MLEYNVAINVNNISRGKQCLLSLSAPIIKARNNSSNIDILNYIFLVINT